MSPLGMVGKSMVEAESKLEVHIFSKHLQFLDYAGMAKAAGKIGFDGVDLTVRPKGHVLPERVISDLPKAVAAIRDEGLKSIMMTSRVTDASNRIDQQVLETAANLGIQYYRMNYFHYLKDQSISDSMEYFQKEAKKLGNLNKKVGIVGCYQNHAGNYIGASIWELWEILRKANPDFIGSQYDIRHAVAEGGMAWSNGLKLIGSQIKTLAIKDFLWKQVDGKWKAVNVPLGTGMVDYHAYFGMLKSLGIKVPVSLHLEYPLGGANHGATELTCEPEVVYDAMKRDLAVLHKLWAEA